MKRQIINACIVTDNFPSQKVLKDMPKTFMEKVFLNTSQEMIVPKKLLVQMADIDVIYAKIHSQQVTI